jgi:hypothetical protein
MKSESRRLERNPTIIQRLGLNYTNLLDFRDSETKSQVLEGTGIKKEKISDFQVLWFLITFTALLTLWNRNVQIVRSLNSGQPS